ncbi:hypothetical protein MSNKSG1_03575 [Marinobacter santoriniensis NKSG1]|uniref:Uncharacterized protein n=1 Tax=Marinobacter santoriniensis NKSG1 TaxID=1288826 RepID=M7CX93_9GAMM|nr:hypothetical protein [Marinobacter santoriniensis]EMP56855.1 hypothetical protein MSNKSG1_03575 [Marinobacter santoriniensis NKSG1]
MESNISTGAATPSSPLLVGVVSPFDQTVSISSEGVIEYEDTQVANPIIRLFAEFVVNVMNEFLSQFQRDHYVSVSSAAYIATNYAGECVIFRAIYVDGDAACALLGSLRDILQELTSGITGARSLFDPPACDSLNSDELMWVQMQIEEFVERHSGKKIGMPFGVQFELGGDVVMPIQGRFCERPLRQTVTEQVEGVAWPDGFSEQSNRIQLIRVDAAGYLERGPLVFQANDASLIRVACEGNFRRRFCRFTGIKTRDSAGKNEFLQLTSLELCNEDSVNSALFQDFDNAGGT